MKTASESPWGGYLREFISLEMIQLNRFQSNTKLLMEVFNGFLFENKILLWLLARPLKVAFCGEYVAKNHQKTNARKQHGKNRQKGACYSNRKKT